MKKNILLLLICFNCFLTSHAETKPVKTESFFNREQYKEVAKDFKYKKTIVVNNNDHKNYKQPNFDWLKYLSYALVFSFLIFLLYKLIQFTYSPKDQELKINAEIMDIPEEEPTIESNLDELLLNALKISDFKEAIRIYYLLAIRELNNQRIIQYTIDKTNFEYLSEIGNHPGFTLFRELTLVFEKIWFGDSLATELILANFKTKYTNLKSTISSFKIKAEST